MFHIPHFIKNSHVRKLAWTLGLFIVLEVFAVATSLYYIIPWFDTFMHFLGGGILALLGLAIAEARGVPISRSHTLAIVLGITLGVGMLWEGIEWYLNRSLAVDILVSIPDSITDMIANTAGALGIYFRALLLSHKKR